VIMAIKDSERFLPQALQSIAAKYRPHAGYPRCKGGIGSSVSAFSIAVASAVMRSFSTTVRLWMAIMPTRRTTVAVNLTSSSNKWAVSACRRYTKAAICSPVSRSVM
jgi:hypothetical protein